MTWQIPPSSTYVDSGDAQCSGNATANAKGPWVELIASTSMDADCVRFTVSLPETAYYGFDLAIGAASSEQMIVEGLMTAAGNSFRNAPQNSLCLPISIPAGSRVSARLQGDDASWGGTAENATASVELFNSTYFDGPLAGSHDVLNYDTSTTSPTNATTTLGNWVELTASSASDICAIAPQVVVKQNRTGSTDYGERWQVGIGAASSEVVIWEGVFCGEVFMPPVSDLTFIDIPAGERIVAKRLSTLPGAVAKSDNMGMLLHVIYR